MNYQELFHSPLIPPSILSLVQKASHHTVPVFIQGERGTGKELIAKVIHYLGDWKYYRFYKVDCNILTDDSFVDQLNRFYKETNYGAIPATLYLKEVGRLRQLDQFRLLELMEDGIFEKETEKKMVKNLRVIASSSENLKEKILKGNFSEDLFQQLNTLSIHLPPLRDRTKEMGAIAQYMLEKHSRTMKVKKVGISNNVLTLLKSYWWPGNLRELEQVILRSAMFSEGETVTEKDLLFEIGNENNTFNAFLKRTGGKSPEMNPSTLSYEQNSNSFSLFLTELVHRIKNPLVSIKTFTQLLQNKFSDMEFREQFYRIVTDDIEKIDGILNGLLSYIKINNPLEKKDTVRSILEDLLKGYEKQLEYKKIKLFKKFQKDLPETVVHDEQLKYILNALLQYAIPSIPPNGSIGILTQSLAKAQGISEDKKFLNREGRYIEIIIIFTGYKKPVEPFQTVLGISNAQKEEAFELELQLVKEVIQKNQGVMNFQVNEKKPRTMISLKFPIERRRIIYYSSIHC
ncbi:MAG: sigma 54-interacting transcriptional regulator [Syntrophaceae bacterium]|nr:sigma 54-interacting transcriptional regulator [Syntrophaceae bacterium]